MIKSVALVSVVLAVGSTAGYLLGARSSSEPRLIAQLSDLQQRVHELELAREADGRALRSVLANVATVAAANGRAAGEAAANDVQAALPAPQAPSDDEQTSGAGRPHTADDHSREALQARREAFLTGLDKAIESAPTDPAWGQPALREAETAVASVLAGARITDKRCGGDLCRIVVEYGPGADPSSADADLMQMSPFNRGSTITHTPAIGREPARSHIYLSHLTTTTGQ